MMNDRIVIPVPGLGVLVLRPEIYRAAIAEGAALSRADVAGSCAVDNAPLVDAKQLATMLTVPATWVEQAAREGRIPSLQFGRWRRFRRCDVEAVMARNNGRP